MKKTVPCRLLRWVLPLCLLLLNQPLSAQQSDTIQGIRIWHAPDHSRVVFDMSQKADYSISLLDNPSRYVVDFNQTNLSGDIPVNQKNQRIEQLRAGLIENGRYRVVIPIKKPLSIKSFQLAPNTSYGHRLVVDLFDAKVNKTEPTQSTASTVGAASIATANNPSAAEPVPVNQPQDYSQPLVTKKEVVVAIDAGHGGKDPGALGSRSQEKNVTLAIAKRLSKIINRTPGMRAVLIRDSDFFVRLRTRTAKARKANADLFISIHADAALNKSARGMSVFALSQRGASSELARALARKENQADLVGGVSIRNKDDELAQVLLDLSLTNKISESVELGSFVLKRLSRLGKLHSKRVEQAGFVVLKSPDIPSILVETGFISNRSEEKRLLTNRFQQQLAEQIYAGVVDYINRNPVQVANANFQITPSQHSLTNFDDNSGNSSDENGSKATVVYHTVKSGDSLSKIASRYGITLKQLKQWNKLKSNVAVKGKRLRVSAKSSPSVAKTKTIRYTVKRGDSLSAIAARYGDSMRAIRQRNRMKSSKVYIGQRLNIVTKTKTSQASNANRTTSTRSTRTTTHTVKRGEHLSSISARYNVPIQRLKEWNKLRSNNIYVGQKLTVSKASEKTKKTQKTLKHKVRRGETLSGLANKYGVKQNDILAWNKLKRKQLLIGQTLLIKTR